MYTRWRHGHGHRGDAAMGGAGFGRLDEYGAYGSGSSDGGNCISPVLIGATGIPIFSSDNNPSGRVSAPFSRAWRDFEVC